MNTEIEISLAELKSVLPGLAKITRTSGTTLPVLGCIKIALDEERKTVALQAHGLDEIATVRLPNLHNGCSGALLVPLDLLVKLVKGCPSNQVMRFLTNGEETRIRYPVAGSFVDRMVHCIPLKEWPAAKILQQEFSPTEEGFKQALSEAMQCVSDDSSRYVLTGVALDVSDRKAHYVVGTNGRFLYAANTFRFNLPETVIIPNRKFLSWPGFINDGPWKLRLLAAVKAEDPKDNQPAWFELQSDKWSYVAQAIDGQFPNWKQVVPTGRSNATRIDLPPAALAMMVEAIPMLPGTEEREQSVVLTAGNGLALRAKGKGQSSWTEVSIPGATVAGKSVAVRLDRNLLLPALRFGFNHMEIEDSLGPVVLTKGQSKTMVVMPIRIKEPQPEKPPAPVPTTQPNASPAPPSTVEAIKPTEERKTMTETTLTAPDRGIRPATNGTAKEVSEVRSAFRAACEQIDTIRTNLKDVLGDLSEVAAMLKAAEKEQRVTMKEVDAVRSKLRDLQSVAL